MRLCVRRHFDSCHHCVQRSNALAIPRGRNRQQLKIERCQRRIKVDFDRYDAPEKLLQVELQPSGHCA